MRINSMEREYNKWSMITIDYPFHSHTRYTSSIRLVCYNGSLSLITIYVVN